jgi:acyl carrier protein
MSNQELRYSIKEMMVKQLMLDVSADSILDTTPIFGPEGLGLDSLDALQLTVALDKNYGLKLTDSEESKNAMACVENIALAIEKL